MSRRNLELGKRLGMIRLATVGLEVLWCPGARELRRL